METSLCPCTSGKTYAECCQPFHEGEAKAPTAELLMRSRYSAFEKQKIEYLRDTLSEESRKTFDRKATADWAASSTWKGLEIHETEKGQPGDEEGIVEFTAHFVMDGKDVAHRERALFRFTEGAWYYEDQIQVPKKPVIREATPGRNDPCSCGSGKKYKKCCAAAA